MCWAPKHAEHGLLKSTSWSEQSDMHRQLHVFSLKKTTLIPGSANHANDVGYRISQQALNGATSLPAAGMVSNSHNTHRSCTSPTVDAHPAQTDPTTRSPRTRSLVRCRASAHSPGVDPAPRHCRLPLKLEVSENERACADGKVRGR